MTPVELELLRCPHCGDRLALGDRVDDQRGRVLRGVLWDQCAAYPVLAGISYLRADEAGRQALDLMAAGRDDVALAVLLAAELTDGAVAVRELLSGDPTFREAVTTLVPGAEALQLLHRFSDPVFRAADVTYRAVAAAVRHDGPVLDLGGGAGHLTRGLIALVDGPVVLADVSFPKLWLARRFLVPDATPVCCDGNTVLPFDDAAFGLVTSSDAFHYVWSRRLLARELRRVRTPDGVLLMTHLHNALVDNPSAGMPLDPAGYRRLFGAGARLVPEAALLAAALAGGPVAHRARPDDELAGSSALAALVTDRELPDVLDGPPDAVPVPLRLNPLYRRTGRPEEWELMPPSEHWADEYTDVHRYLPRTTLLPEKLLARAAAGERDEEIVRLRRCSLLLDLPGGYL